MMNNNDKRVRKTKLSIQSALFDLLDEFDFEHITVQMIIDRAFIGKGTFYYHYQDKYDLAEQIYRSFLDSIQHSIKMQLNRIEHGKSTFAEIGNYTLKAMNEYAGEYKCLSKLKQFDLDHDLKHILYHLIDDASQKKILNIQRDDLWIYAEIILNYLRHAAQTNQVIAYYDYIKQIHSFTGQYLDLLDTVR